MSVRTTAALIATSFNVHLGPGEDGSDLLESTEVIFTLSKGCDYCRSILKYLGINN
jgi:hypothetical protein